MALYTYIRTTSQKSHALTESPLIWLMTAHHAANAFNLNHISKLCHYELIKSYIHII